MLAPEVSASTIVTVFGGLSLSAAGSGGMSRASGFVSVVSPSALPLSPKTADPAGLGAVSGTFGWPSVPKISEVASFAAGSGEAFRRTRRLSFGFGFSSCLESPSAAVGMAIGESASFSTFATRRLTERQQPGPTRWHLAREHCHPLNPGCVRPSPRRPTPTSAATAFLHRCQSLHRHRLANWTCRVILIGGYRTVQTLCNGLLVASFAAARPATFSAFGLVIAIFSITV